ncbi:MAG TPA: TIGR01777 family oxidoreductase [Mycobacteriales bacterium]|nr:TIGR01777 family oxidoreductase [Mycobacteriales bacterium]
MKVVVTGSTGLIGSALVRNLRADNHDVLRLVRHAPRAADEVQWQPSSGFLEPDVVNGVDAVVHLAGAGIGDHRWTEDYKRVIRESRVSGTTAVAQAIASAAQPPRVLVSGSAVGYYGDTGEEACDESSPSGDGFLASVVRDWEAASAPASEAGVRVVNIRTGIVLSADGGLLKQMLPIFKLGLGGRLGSGRQWFSWISIADHVAAVRYLMADDDLSGPVNVTAPEPVRNKEFTKALARAVHRPAVAVVPSVALKAALGGFAEEGALVSQRVLPARLEAAGFTFTFADIDAALRALVD